MKHEKPAPKKPQGLKTVAIKVIKNAALKTVFVALPAFMFFQNDTEANTKPLDIAPTSSFNFTEAFHAVDGALTNFTSGAENGLSNVFTKTVNNPHIDMIHGSNIVGGNPSIRSGKIETTGSLSALKAALQYNFHKKIPTDIIKTAENGVFALIIQDRGGMVEGSITYPADTIIESNTTPPSTKDITLSAQTSTSGRLEISYNIK